jgi:uncharacterized protein with LGFP repeats
MTDTASSKSASSWRKSTYSTGAAQCAEVGQSGPSNTLNTLVAVRDTKEAHLGDDRTVLSFSAGAWQDFISRLKS